MDFDQEAALDDLRKYETRWNHKYHGEKLWWDVLHHLQNQQKQGAEPTHSNDIPLFETDNPFPPPVYVRDYRTAAILHLKELRLITNPPSQGKYTTYHWIVTSYGGDVIKSDMDALVNAAYVRGIIERRSAEGILDEGILDEEILDEGILELLRDRDNVIVEGVAGCGKSMLWERFSKVPEFSDPEHRELAVFHSSTSYEEFVSGLRPTPDGGFEGTAGVFIDMCNRAASDPDGEYLLFIDEINRANTARVMGDLMLALEESKRVNKETLAGIQRDGALLSKDQLKASGDALTKAGAVWIRLQTPVTAPFNKNPRITRNSPSRTRRTGRHIEYPYLIVPENLYVLGTMNTTDRSVGTIDLALRRRFEWYTMEPLAEEVLKTELSKTRSEEEVVELSGLFDWFGKTNESLRKSVSPDAQLGHSYFFQSGTPEAIAKRLLTQLAAIAEHFIFDPEAIGIRTTLSGWQVGPVGDGPGKRMVVERMVVEPGENSNGIDAADKPPSENTDDDITDTDPADH